MSNTTGVSRYLGGESGHRGFFGGSHSRTRVILELQSPREQWQALGDGYRVDIEFITASKENTLAIPTSALIRHGDGWAVWRIEDGRARLIPVQTGLRAATHTEITTGLAQGDSVILQPDDTIRDGILIKKRP